jgi:GH24 family phage-related lysozyme (muramidase)
MTPELLTAVSLNLAKHEGRLLSMYLDSVGVVTCGVGHALFTPGDAYNICWWKDTSTLATREEVNAGWSSVKYKNSKRALLISYEETDRLLQSDLTKFERVIRSTFADVDTYPHLVQVALYDICFNCGSFTKWPHFSAAIHAHNWKLAATHSLRPQVGNSRNEDTFEQLNMI